jgi:hypothetical protein
MFIPPEEDHFPGQFTNVYQIEFISDFMSFKNGEKLEVEGLDSNFFLYFSKSETLKIPKTVAKVLKKMIKAKK